MFSHDLRDALIEADPTTPVEIVSILRDPRQVAQPEVVAAIRQDVRSDYAAVAATLSSRGTDVVLIEHEYGIFGGDAGAFVVSLAEELEQPLVVTLHPVLLYHVAAMLVAQCLTALFAVWITHHDCAEDDIARTQRSPFLTDAGSAPRPAGHPPTTRISAHPEAGGGVGPSRAR